MRDIELYRAILGLTPPWTGSQRGPRREGPAGHRLRPCSPRWVDVSGCTREFRDRLLTLRERNSTLVRLIFWLVFRRGDPP